MASTMGSAPDRYGIVAVALHWLIALAIMGMLVMGNVMVNVLTPFSSEQFAAYQWHKSIGITILALSVLRLIWRLTHPVPPLPDTLKPWERVLARLTHIGFYGLMLGIPLSGWAMVSASVYDIPTVLYDVLPLPHLPVFSTLTEKAPVEEALKTVHQLLGWSMIGLLALHIGAALKHHFILKDGVVRRMLPFDRDRQIQTHPAQRESEP